MAETITPEHAWKVRVRPIGPGIARAYARNHAFEVGRAASYHERDARPCAIELLVGALGGDLLDGWRRVSGRMGIDTFAAELDLAATLAEPLGNLGVAGAAPPGGIARITGTFHVSASGDAERHAAIWREVLDHSPLHRTLCHSLVIDIRFEPTL